MCSIQGLVDQVNQEISTRGTLCSLLNMDALVPIYEYYEFVYDVCLRLGEMFMTCLGGRGREAGLQLVDTVWFQVQDSL